MPDPTEIAAVTLAVRDLGRVTEFYRTAIGLDPIETAPGSAWLGAGGRRFLQLLHRPDLEPVDPAAAGLFHTAFLLPAMADLGRWLRHAADRHLRIDGAADHLVSNAVYLSDPEGNGIEIYADRPRSTWRWEAGQVVMANDRPDLAGLVALDPAPWIGAPSDTTIGHVHLQVGDIARAEPFYADGLGLTVTRRWPRALFLSAAGYHHHLAVNTWRSAGAVPRDPGRAGLRTLTLLTRDPAPAPKTDPWGTTIDFTNGAHP